MSDPFTPVGADGGPPDLTKSVRYVEGMVLGVGDFEQEHLYLAGLANEALRLGAGVGTLWGLKVTTAAGTPATKMEVHVGAGTAVDGRGRIVRVPEEQCADIGAWVAAQKPSDVAGKVQPPNAAQGTLPVFVTLAYARVDTDEVPIPGEPCRSDAQLRAASRRRDDFRLDLALAAPASRLRQAMLQYLVWTKYALTLGAVASPATPDARNTLLDNAAKLLADCRARAATDRFLPASLPTTPPPALTAVVINKDDFELQMACLDAANVALVTDVLPGWLGAGPAESPDLLLAEISATVKKGAGPNDPWSLDTATAPPVSSRARPVALSGPTLRVGPRVP